MLKFRSYYIHLTLILSMWPDLIIWNKKEQVYIFMKCRMSLILSLVVAVVVGCGTGCGCGFGCGMTVVVDSCLL